MSGHERPTSAELQGLGLSAALTAWFAGRDLPLDNGAAMLARACIRHEGWFDLAHVTVFGGPHYSISHEDGNGEISVGGHRHGSPESFAAAKAVYEAMANVEATDVDIAATSAGAQEKRSSNGAISCRRWARDGAEQEFDCTFRVHVNPAVLDAIQPVNRCDAGKGTPD